MIRFLNKNFIILFAYILFLGGISYLVGCENRDSRKEFYSDGSLKAIAEYKENVQDGERVDYYENGEIKSKSHWKNGKQHGLGVFYFPTGAIKSKFNWSDGQLDGYYEKYYENGQLQGYGYFKDGLEDGNYKLYYPSGELMQEGSYRKDIKHGEQKVFFKNGKIKTKKHFLNLKGQENMSSYIGFKEDGTIVNEYKRIEIIPSKDTVTVGEPITINIQLFNPRFDSTQIILGTKGFDEVFNVANPEVLDTIKAEEHKVVYQVILKESGKYYLRGFADNFEVTEVKGDSVTTIANHFYFELPFYVKK